MPRACHASTTIDSIGFTACDGVLAFLLRAHVLCGVVRPTVSDISFWCSFLWNRSRFVGPAPPNKVMLEFEGGCGQRSRSMVKERLHPLSNDRSCFRFGIGEGLREQISRRGLHGPGTEATQSLPCSLVCGLTFLRSFAIACLATVGVVRELVLRVRGPVVSGRIHFSLSSRAAQCVFPGVREHAWAPLRGAVDLSHQIATSGSGAKEEKIHVRRLKMFSNSFYAKF